MENEMSIADYELNTPRQKYIFALTVLGGKIQEEMLGIDIKTYRSESVAREWHDTIMNELVDTDSVAITKLQEIYKDVLRYVETAKNKDVTEAVVTEVVVTKPEPKPYNIKSVVLKVVSGEEQYNKRAYVQKKDFKGKNWKRWK